MNPYEKSIEKVYNAFAKGDIPTVLSLLSPDCKWLEAEGGPYGGLFIGPDQVLENVFMKLGGAWSGFTAIPSEIISKDNTVIAIGEYRGVYKETAKEFQAPFAHVWKFTGDKVTSFHQFTDTALQHQAMS